MHVFYYFISSSSEANLDRTEIVVSAAIALMNISQSIGPWPLLAQSLS